MGCVWLDGGMQVSTSDTHMLIRASLLCSTSPAVLGQVPRRTAVLPDPHVDRRNHSGAAEMLLSYPPFIAVPGESSLHALMAAT